MFIFFNDTATTEIYTLSLHDALPIYGGTLTALEDACAERARGQLDGKLSGYVTVVQNGIDLDDLERAEQVRLGNRLERERSEEHTSELQSRQYLVCRLLLEKKKKSTG